MDDEDLILMFSDISGDGKAITYKSSGNPFITSAIQQKSDESRLQYNTRIIHLERVISLRDITLSLWTYKTKR
jgi:hypothetical protein